MELFAKAMLHSLGTMKIFKKCISPHSNDLMTSTVDFCKAWGRFLTQYIIFSCNLLNHPIFIRSLQRGRFLKK